MLEFKGRDPRVGTAKGRDARGRDHRKMIESVIKTKEKREMMECKKPVAEMKMYVGESKSIKGRPAISLDDRVIY